MKRHPHSRYFPPAGPKAAFLKRGETLVVPIKAQGIADLTELGYADASGVDFELVADMPVPWQIRELEARVRDLEARASTKFLAALGDPSVRLRRPIPVFITTAQGVVTVEASDLEIYGDGETEYEAFATLRRRIVENFRELAEEQEMLGPELAALLGRYRELIEVDA